MELVGKVFFKSPIEEGVSRAGRAWKKRFYVVETQDTYPRKVAFTVFGEDRVNEMENRISEGMLVRVSFDLESREYNGRWYTSIRGWKVDKDAPGEMPAGPGDYPAPAPVDFPPTSADEDLPF